MTPLASISRIRPGQLLEEGHAMACQANPDLFFPDTDAEVAEAKAVCASCPARVDCLAQALTQHEGWGVWGGTLFYAGRQASRIPPRGALSHRRYAS